MNNIELEQKVLEIIKEDNYFEMIIKAIAFEKEYKTSDFYKATKKPLMEMIREAKLYYAMQLKDLGRAIQSTIDGLSLEHLSELLDQANEVFSSENKEILEGLEVFKNLKN